MVVVILASGRLADIKVVFERRMISETKFYKVFDSLSCARGCPKYVINITFVKLRLVPRVIFEHLPLNIANEETSMVWAHFSSHGYAPNLLVVFIV